MENRRTTHTPWKCSICGSENHLVEKNSRQPKDNDKRRKQVRLNEKCNHACDNVENNSDQKIYASMTRMSGNDECSSGNFGKSS